MATASGLDRQQGDPIKMQILATEHWSLLATRSLTYSESLSRVTMFLSVLSGAVIALALIAQADRFGRTFVLIAILVLSVVLFVGIATVVRLGNINRDDMRWVIGMNRIRHAYLELRPELEPYFVAGQHDDARGVFLTLGFETLPSGSPKDALHGIQTLPGMIAVIVAVVAGALGALVANSLSAPAAVDVVAAVAAFVRAIAAFGYCGQRAILKFTRNFAPRFPGATESQSTA